MAAALSLDLRERVIAAIEAGASCRQAAERFGVGKASAIRWHARFRAEGQVSAKPMGGDRHSHRVEAHAALILQALKERPQIYLREVRDALQEHGAAVSLSGRRDYSHMAACLKAMQGQAPQIKSLSEVHSCLAQVISLCSNQA